MVKQTSSVTLIATMLVVMTIQYAEAAKYPKDLPRCPLGDNKCVCETGTVLLKKFAKGDPRINLVSIDPLHISKMTLKQGASSPVNIELNFKEVDLIGLSNHVFESISGFGKDPNGKFEFRLKGPALYVVGPYTISGRVLVLPIQGDGLTNLTLYNPDLLVRFTGKSEIRKGKEYLTTDDLKLTFNITRLGYYFENLYNGDKRLGDSTNTFLNENWEDIYKELRPLIFDGFTLIVQQTLVNMFNKVPFRELFADDPANVAVA